MKTRSIAAFASVTVLLTLGLSAAAQAQPVYWSVGLSSPGVQVGFSATPPVVLVQPNYQPVYVQPRPLYVVPRPVYYARPAPVVVRPPHYIHTDWRYGADRHRWEERRERQERWEGQHSDRGEHDRRG